MYIFSAHLTKDCWWLVDAILEYTSMSRLPSVFMEDGQPAGNFQKKNVVTSRKIFFVKLQHELIFWTFHEIDSYCEFCNFPEKCFYIRRRKSIITINKHAWFATKNGRESFTSFFKSLGHVQHWQGTYQYQNITKVSHLGHFYSRTIESYW